MRACNTCKERNLLNKTNLSFGDSTVFLAGAIPSNLSFKIPSVKMIEPFNKYQFSMGCSRQCMMLLKVVFILSSIWKSGNPQIWFWFSRKFVGSGLVFTFTHIFNVSFSFSVYLWKVTKQKSYLISFWKW